MRAAKAESVGVTDPAPAGQAEQLELSAPSPLMIEIVNNSGQVEATGSFEDWWRDNEVAPLAVEIMRAELRRGATLNRASVAGSNIRPGYTLRSYLGDWQVEFCDRNDNVLDKDDAPTLSALFASITLSRGAALAEPDSIRFIRVGRGGALIDSIDLDEKGSHA